jgi:hypothetical protein
VDVIRHTGGNSRTAADPENELIITLSSRHRRHCSKNKKSRKK